MLRAITLALGKNEHREIVPLPGIADLPLAAHPHSLRLLLGEDNPVNQALAVRILERKSFHVTVAPTGKAVTELADSELFDVILMDVQMPEMDGYAATRIIRKREVDL